MKRTLRTLPAALVVSLSVAAAASADVEIPAASPAASVSQTVGVTKVTIDYHRPGVKGRKIWGELVPYDKVWRLGANEATTITFTDPVKIKGRELAAGSYALFAIPKPGVFTLVFNTDAKQWGATAYDAAKDVLRFDVQPETGKSTEWMTFEMVPARKSVLRVEWRWERLRFSFDVEVDVDRVVWSRLDAALAKPSPSWEDYLSAAQFAWEEKTRLPEAKGWVDRSIALKESVWNLELKARLLANEGSYREAVALVEKAKEVGKDTLPKEERDVLDKALAEWRAKAR